MDITAAQAITWGLTFVGLALTVVLFLLNQKKKQFAYKLTASSLMPNKTGLRSNELKILIGDTHLRSPTLFEIEFINRGKTSIENSDFDNAVLLVASGNIHWAALQSKHPTDLPVAYEIVTIPPPYNPGTPDTKTLKIEPLLMNAGDKFKLHFIADASDKNLDIKCRISGVKTILSLDPDSSQPVVGVLIQILVGFLLPIAGAYLTYPTMSSTNTDKSWPTAVFIMSIISGFLIVASGVKRLQVRSAG